MVPSDIVAIVIQELISLTPALVDKAQQSETAVKILDKAGLKPNTPPANLEACYVFALVEFAKDGTKPQALLNFFRVDEVRKAFIADYANFDVNKVIEVIEWHVAGDALKKSGVDVRAEFESFKTLFEDFAIRTSTPADLVILRRLKEGQFEKQQSTNSSIAIPVDESPKLLADEETSFLTRIEEANRLRELGYSTAAKQLLVGVEKDIVGKKFSNYLHLRLETIQGACAYDLGREQQAIQYFESALLWAPDDYKALANAALANMLRGKYQDAADLAQQSLNKHDDAKNTSAPAIRLEALTHLKNFENVEGLINDKYFDNTNYLRVAGMLFLKASQYDKAEDLFRRALLIEQDDPFGMMFLAQVLYLGEKEQKVKQVFYSPYEDHSTILELEEPLQLLKSAVELSERKENRKPLHDILASRAGILAAKGESSAAIQDCNRVLVENPDHLMALYNRGLIALEQQDYELAIKCLSRVIKEKTIDLDPYIPLASAYVEKKEPEAAIQMLDETPPEVLARALPEVFAIRSNALLMMGDTQAVEKAKAEILAMHSEDSLMLEAVANVDFLQDQKDEGLNHLLMAYEYAEGRQGEHLALRIGTHYFHRQEYTDAIAYLETLDSQLEHQKTLARTYLAALYRAKQFSKAYQFARTLYAQGSVDPSILETLAWISEWTGDFTGASEVYGKLAITNPDQHRYKILQARAEFRRANYDETHSILEGVDPEILTDPRDLMESAQMLLYLGQTDGVVEMAYRARQLGINHPEIHLAYFHIFFVCEQSNPKKFEVDQVGPDTAVRLKEQHGQDKWIRLHKSFPTTKAQNEFAMSDGISQALLGRVKGDKVSLEGMYEPLVYTIEDIQSIYVRAVQETMENFETWFPENHSLGKVYIENNDPTKFLQFVAGQSTRAQEVHAEYDRGELTLSQFASAVGKSEFEIWRGLVGKKNHRIIASTGTAEEQRYHGQVVRNAQAVTLDIGALLTDRYLHVLDILPKIFEKLYISQGIIDRTTRYLFDLRWQVNSTHGTASFEDGRFYFEETSREIVQAEINRTEELMEFLRTHCEVVPLETVVLDWIGEEKTNRLLDQISITTLVVARQTNSVLYADDLRLREIAAKTMGINGIWTQPLLTGYVEKGILAEYAYYEKALQLVQAHYYFTSVDFPLIKYLLEKHNLHMNQEVDAVLRTLSGPHTTEDTAVNIVAQIIKHAWFTNSITGLRVSILIECLNVLTTNRNTSIIVHKLVSRLNGDLGLKLAGNTLSEILDIIETWRREHDARNRSSVLR